MVPALLIEHRPAEAADRLRIGHWEGDLITGRGGLSAIGTMACRRSRYIKLIHLPGGRTAEELVDAIHATLAEVPEGPGSP